MQLSPQSSNPEIQKPSSEPFSQSYSMNCRILFIQFPYYLSVRTPSLYFCCQRLNSGLSPSHVDHCNSFLTASYFPSGPTTLPPHCCQVTLLNYKTDVTHLPKTHDSFSQLLNHTSAVKQSQEGIYDGALNYLLAFFSLLQLPIATLAWTTPNNLYSIF